MGKILITGGAGFIGEKLAKNLLARGKRLVILDNLSPQIHGAGSRMPDWTRHPNVEAIFGSVTDRSALEQALQGVTAVAHLAAETGTGQSMYEIARYNQVNSQGTALLMDILLHSDDVKVQRVVLTSSRSIYGEGRYQCAKCQNNAIFPAARSAEALASAQWEPVCETCDVALAAARTGDGYPAARIDLCRH